MKNRTRRIDSQIWQRRFDNKVFAVCPNFASFKDSKGWLVELMNSVSGGSPHWVWLSLDVFIVCIPYVGGVFSECDPHWAFFLAIKCVHSRPHPLNTSVSLILFYINVMIWWQSGFSSPSSQLTKGNASTCLIAVLHILPAVSMAVYLLVGTL